jgi:hypothetical protein
VHEDGAIQVVGRSDSHQEDAETAPNFFVVGAARSGTTMLVEMLRQHPDVFITRPKEPHYLAFAEQRLSFGGPGDDQTINSRAVTDFASYTALYDLSTGHTARGDASVSSLYFPENSLSVIAQRFPEARIVAVLRDPHRGRSRPTPFSVSEASSRSRTFSRQSGGSPSGSS